MFRKVYSQGKVRVKHSQSNDDPHTSRTQQLLRSFDIEPISPPTLLAHVSAATAGRFMHMLPAGLWSVIAPLQLSPTFRAKHRTAHRRLGRLFIIMSVSISLGVVAIVRSGASFLRQSVRFAEVEVLERGRAEKAVCRR